MLATKIAGVIKADDYKHGDIPVAKTLENLVDFYAVSTLNEALNLYYHNLYKPILVLGPLPGDDYRELVENNIRATVFTLKQAGRPPSGRGARGGAPWGRARGRDSR